MDGGTMAVMLAGFPSLDSTSDILGLAPQIFTSIIYEHAKWKFNKKFTVLHSSPITLESTQTEDRFLEGKLKKDAFHTLPPW